MPDEGGGETPAATVGASHLAEAREVTSSGVELGEAGGLALEEWTDDAEGESSGFPRKLLD